MRRQVGVLLSILALATSLPGCAQVLKGSTPNPEKTPSPNRLLLPSSAFSGGILTGYVIGPDDQPVPNAPVAINGGVLMGEVIGDPTQKNQPPDDRPKFPWVGTNTGGSFSDWKKTALDSCKAGKAAINWGDRPADSGNAPAPQPRGLTNAAGGFIVCVPPDAKDVQVSLPGDRGDGGATSVLIGLDQPSVQGLSDPPSFCGRGQRFDLNGAFPRASYEQDGKAGEMPVAMALNGDGKTALTTFECSNNLHPGPVKLSITDGTSHVREYQTHIFRFLDGALDQTRLMGGQPADFWYEIQMGPEEAGKSLCVAVTVAGPVVLTKPPAHKVTLNGDGRARVSGKIRATHVAPGSTIPFVVSPHFAECGR